MPLENPVLKMRHVAICLHFLSSGKGPDAISSSCKYFGSFEIDILSHIYQNNPPLASQCLEPKPVEIRFPDSISYVSEGQLLTSNCRPEERTKKAMAYPSLTCFKDGIRVYHLTLTPVSDSYFSEYDLIKLVKMYGGLEEKLTGMSGSQDGGVKLDTRLRYFVPPAGKTPSSSRPQDTMDIHELRRLLFYGQRPESDARLVASTIEICTSGKGFGWTGSQTLSSRYKAATMDRIYGYVEVIPQNKAGAIERIKRDLRTEHLSGILAGLYSMIQGILNKRADPAEIADVFDPTVKGANGLLRIHKGTLFHLIKEDQVFDTVRKTIGINPYLIIPQAALLHNDHLVSRAESIIDKADGSKKRKQIAESVKEASMLLKGQFLPNVFHYRTEKEIFEQGMESRGISSKYTLNLKRLEALQSRLNSIIEETQSRANWRLQVFLLLLTLVQAVGILIDVNNSGGIVRAISGLDNIAKVLILIFGLFSFYFLLFLKKR